MRLGEAPQEMPESLEEFDASVSVLGRKGFNAGRKYWDVVVGSEGDWAVGVATKPAKKKQAKCSRARIRALGKLDGQYQFFCPSGDDCVNCSVELRRVRVSLNCLGKYMTFFDGDGGGLIHQAMLPSVREGLLFPFFQVGKKAILTLVPSGQLGF